MLIYLKKKTQIKALLFDKIFTKVLTKYSNYSNVFLAKNTIKILKYIKIDDHIIKLEKNKQLFFVSIYSQNQ